MVHFLAEQSHWATRGGVVIFEVPEGDLSISEVARLAEGAGTRVIACTTSQPENSSNVEVTLKVATEDIEPVIQTFQRFGHSIHSFCMHRNWRRKCANDTMRSCVIYDNSCSLAV